MLPLPPQITTMGSLDERSTKFLMGEVVAALSSIHDKGFVYGDLKPENIVLTTTGHAKLTDFGAVRPLTGTRFAATVI
jgi:serine/threonine protein kinase